MMSTPERDMPFFALVEALQAEGCALCRLIGKQTRRSFDHLLYEAVNDGEFRQRWRRGRGVCHRHAWLLAASGNAPALGIWYLDLLEHVGDAMLTEPRVERCFACEAEAGALRGRLELLQTHWSDQKLREAVAQSDGFCGPHLRAARRLIRTGRVREAVTDVSLRRWRELGPRLRALIDSFDYQHEQARDLRIAHAWREAIEKAVGRQDLAAEQHTPDER